MKSSLKTPLNEESSKENTISFMNKKALTTSSNSLASAPYSEDYSVSGMGRELKKKINYR